MSVASEIEQLATNLSNIKTAITAKGGTVAEGAGFDDIATAVGTISGGSPTPDPRPADPITRWGAIMYYSKMDENWSVNYANGCTVNSINAAKLSQFVSDHEIEMFMDELMMDYNDGFWNFGWGGMSVAQEDLLNETGIDITLTDSESASVSLKKTGTPASDAEVLVAEVTDQAEWETISVETSYPMSVGGVSIPAAAVKRIVFGSEATSVGSNSFRGCGVETISALPSGLYSVGAYFLGECPNFNCPIDFSNTTEMQVPLVDSLNFNSSVTFGEQLPGGFPEVINESSATLLSDPNIVIDISRVTTARISHVDSYLAGRGMENFCGTIYVGNASVPTGMKNSNSLAIYENKNCAFLTRGVKIKGANRAAWLAAFPNSSAAKPYRNLIDGGE